MPRLPKRWKRPEWRYSDDERARQHAITIGLTSAIVGLVIATIALWTTREFYPASFASAMNFLAR
jgi:hypothetical protein